MSVVDIIIIVFILFGGVLGFKRGFTRELVSFLGIFVITILSFILKNPLGTILYNNLPFFKFKGVFLNLTAINILIYEIIAFFIVFFVLSILFRILLKITKVFEKILNATIILGIPSKILGMIVGIIHHLIYAFLILYILSLPIFNLSIINNSKVSKTILNKTPLLGSVCDNTLNIYNEIKDLKKEYKNEDNNEEYNSKILNIMIEKNIITKENVNKLIEQGKIKASKFNVQ